MTWLLSGDMRSDPKIKRRLLNMKQSTETSGIFRMKHIASFVL
jgi:hypothetical protein